MGTIYVLIFIIILLMMSAWLGFSSKFERIGELIENKIIKPFTKYDEKE